MAIPRKRLQFNFVSSRPEIDKNERFFRRVNYPNVRPVEQPAVAITKNKEIFGSISNSINNDNAVKQDIEKRIRRALLEKEATLQNLADARYKSDYDAENFYTEQARVLDNLIKDLKAEYDRVNLTKAYLTKLDPIQFGDVLFPSRPRYTEEEELVDWARYGAKAKEVEKEGTPKEEAVSPLEEAGTPAEEAGTPAEGKEAVELFYQPFELADKTNEQLRVIMDNIIKTKFGKGTPRGKELRKKANAVKHKEPKEKKIEWILWNQR